MSKKKNKYHIRISTRFLLFTKIENTSEYFKWIYIYIKLKYNYYIQKKPNESFELDVDEMSEFFNIHRVTVFKCLKQLTEYGLLTKEERGKYKIICEKQFINNHKSNEDANSKDHFLKIYNNVYMDLWQSGVNAKEAELYFYLVNENRHHLENKKWLEVTVSQNQACKHLKIDHRTYKGFVKHLITIGYLNRNDKKKLFTLSPKPLELLEEETNVIRDAVINIKENSFQMNSEEIPITFIDSKMKLDPELGSIENKRKLYKCVKYPVVKWLLRKRDNIEYVFPVTKNPEFDVDGYETFNSIRVERAAAYGVDIKRCEWFGLSATNNMVSG